MKNKLITIVGIASVLASTGVFADPTIQVSFPEKGSYLYWMEYQNSEGKIETTAPKHASGDSTSIDLAPASDGTKLAEGELKIYEPKSGNVAVKTIENLEGKKDLKLKSADFDRVRTVKITLKPQDAKPNERVESAVVKLKDANSDEFRALVDPSSEGVAIFHDVAAGQESVTIGYEGGSMTVDVEIPADRDTAIFEKTYPVPDKVRTITVASAAAATSPDQDKPAAKADTKAAKSSGAGILQILMSFVFLALIGFIVYVVLKNRGVTMKGSLNKMGVQLPQDDQDMVGQDAAQPATPQVDPNVCAFCGQRKDPATGNCVCTVTPGGSSPSSMSVPRLIGSQGTYSGHIFDLNAENATMGRDIGNTISLPNDTTVSRVHARLTRSNGTTSITDEGSSNGTFVNGVRLAGAQPLRAGDEVQVGNTRFRFEC